MSCCSNKERNQQYIFAPKVSTQTSIQPRKCTDIAYLIVLILMIIADAVIFFVAIAQDPVANPEYLYKGHNYNGDICHQKTSWVDPTYPQITECVTHCSEVASYESISFEKYWCVPNKTARAHSHFKFNKASATYLRTVGDLYILWPLVALFSVAGSILISLFYLFMISINRRLLAYSIMNIIFGVIAGVLLIYHGYEDYHDDLTDNTAGVEIFFGILSLCFAFIIAVWLHYDRQSLTTEIEMMAEAIQTVKKLWSAVLFCCLYSIWILACFAAWIVSALYIYSVPIRQQEKTPNALMDAMNDTNEYTAIMISNYKYVLIYHVIFAIYIMFIFCYFGYLVLSHVILVWYLGKDKDSNCCLNWPPKQIQSVILVKNMSTQDIIQWIQSMNDEYITDANDETVRRLIKVVQDKSIDGQKICEDEVHYTVLKKWMTQQNEDERSNDRIAKVAEAFFNQVRKRSNKEKIGPTQAQIVWNAYKTIFYHIGTAALAAWLALFGVMDIYPLIHPWIRKKKWCIKDDEANNTSYDIEMTEMLTFDKDEMYKAYKKKIFPLIDTKIQNIAKEYMLSAAVDRTMTNITRHHYGLALGVDSFSMRLMNSDGLYQEEEKYDGVEAGKIISVINDNINQFDYETEIKDDIYKIMERNLAKLKREIKRKEREIQSDEPSYGRSVTGLTDSVYDDANNYGKIRKEGLIFTSLYGTSFNLSSYNASKLEKANITRLADVEGFSAYNERFGRIGIATTNTALAVIAMFIYDALHHHISSFIMPTFIIFLVSYTIGYIFTSILEVTVSTLLFCVIINEEKWKQLFKINQGKIKQNVSGLANNLSAMISEHQLIMQLKEPEVNEKIRAMNKNIVAPNVSEKDLTKAQKKKIHKGVKRLMDVKRKALQSEEELLNTIDGPMKLTQYLIDVILVENYFNKQYKKDKAQQEQARRLFARDIFKEEQYENITPKQSKKIMYDKVMLYKEVRSFLNFYPNDEQKEKQIIDAWKRTVQYLESELRDKGDITHFKMSEAQKKGIERAFYKSFYSYHDKQDGFRYLTDVLRCSIKFRDFMNLYKTFKYIYEEMKDTLEIIRVKDRFNSTSEKNGYRDFMINVLVKKAPPNNDEDDDKNVPNDDDDDKNVLEGIICEIQLHHETFYDAKRVSHKMYKKTRLFETNDGNKAYQYAVKYVRPVIGRFKVYPVDEEQDKIDIFEIIGGKMEKLAKEYCRDIVIPKLEENKGYIIKQNIDMSVLAAVQQTKLKNTTEQIYKKN